MLDLDAIRIPEEHHYRSLIAHHPALVTLRVKLGPDWEQYARARTLPPAPHGSAFSKGPSLQAWTAAADVAANLGVFTPIELSVGGTSLDSLEGCRFARETDRLRISIPAGVQSLFAETELRAGLADIIGHCLLGHYDVNDVNTVVTIATSSDPVLYETLRSEQSLAQLIQLGHVLAQLQELSADRAALVGSKNFDAAATVALKLTYGRSSVLVNLEDTLRLIEPVQNDSLWIERNHPYGPNRLLALLLANENGLGHSAKEAASSQAISPLYRLLPKLVPLVEGEAYRPRETESESERIDRMLVELIMVDTIAVNNRRWDAAAERLINQLIPAHYYDRVMQRYDRVSEDIESEDMLLHWLKKAARRPAAWKRTMIERLLYAFGSVTLTSDEAFVHVSWLARAIDAPIHPTQFSASSSFARLTLPRVKGKEASGPRAS